MFIACLEVKILLEIFQIWYGCKKYYQKGYYILYSKNDSLGISRLKIFHWNVYIFDNKGPIDKITTMTN